MCVCGARAMQSINPLNERDLRPAFVAAAPAPAPPVGTRPERALRIGPIYLRLQGLARGRQTSGGPVDASYVDVDAPLDLRGLETPEVCTKRRQRGDVSIRR